MFTYSTLSFYKKFLHPVWSKMPHFRTKKNFLKNIYYYPPLLTSSTKSSSKISKKSYEWIPRTKQNFFGTKWDTNDLFWVIAIFPRNNHTTVCKISTKILTENPENSCLQVKTQTHINRHTEINKTKRLRSSNLKTKRNRWNCDWKKVLLFGCKQTSLNHSFNEQKWFEIRLIFAIFGE